MPARVKVRDFVSCRFQLSLQIENFRARFRIKIRRPPRRTPYNCSIRLRSRYGATGKAPTSKRAPGISVLTSSVSGVGLGYVRSITEVIAEAGITKKGEE